MDVVADVVVTYRWTLQICETYSQKLHSEVWQEGEIDWRQRPGRGDRVSRAQVPLAVLGRKGTAARKLLGGEITHDRAHLVPNLRSGVRNWRMPD